MEVDHHLFVEENGPPFAAMFHEFSRESVCAEALYSRMTLMLEWLTNVLHIVCTMYLC